MGASEVRALSGTAGAGLVPPGPYKPGEPRSEANSGRSRKQLGLLGFCAFLKGRGRDGPGTDSPLSLRLEDQDQGLGDGYYCYLLLLE